MVRATGDRIKRGIIRDFPTAYTNRFGHKVKVGFQVLEVRRDGAPESYRVESVAESKKIYLGQKDIFLSLGVDTYTLKYRTTRHLGFFREFDELYWNVTGNAWTFPLDQVGGRNMPVIPASWGPKARTSWPLYATAGWSSPAPRASPRGRE